MSGGEAGLARTIARVPLHVRTLCIVLVAVSATTFWMGSGHAGPFGPVAASSCLVIVGFAKACAIGWYLMEVATASPVLRGLLLAWAGGFAVVCGMLVLG